MGLTLRPLLGTAVLGVVFGLVGAAPASGQAVITGAALAVGLEDENGEAAVRLTYDVQGLSEIDSVRAVLLLPRGARVTDLIVDGRPQRLVDAGGMRREAVFGSVDESRGRIEVGYTVESALESGTTAVRARVPVLTLSLPPVEGEDVLTASVTVPEAWVVTESFPSGLRREEAGLYAVSLPVVPSQLTLRARTDGRWRPGVPMLVELFVATVLLAFGFLGWQGMRERRR